jgi:hypothetical protein
MPSATSRHIWSRARRLRKSAQRLWVASLVDKLHSWEAGRAVFSASAGSAPPPKYLKVRYLQDIELQQAYHSGAHDGALTKFPANAFGRLYRKGLAAMRRPNFVAASSCSINVASQLIISPACRDTRRSKGAVGH